MGSRGTARLLTCLVVAAGTLVCGCSGSSRSVSLQVTPGAAPYGAPLTVRATGVAPGHAVEFTATVTDADGTRWRGQARVVADRDGVASPTTQPSTGGSYTGLHPQALFTQLAPVGRPDVTAFRPVLGHDAPVEVAATADGTTARTTVTRQTPTDIVRLVPERLATAGVYAILALPRASKAGRHAAVLVLGGSEGGLPTALADELAEHGIPALALAYFGEPGLPATLKDVPLEYVARGARLLAAQPSVDPARVIALGVSRGSEAALLTAATYPDLVHGVVATVPSAYLWVDLPPTGSASWTLHGRPLPFEPLDQFGVAQPAVVPGAEIPVERIAGPVVTVCGGQDALWPSCPYAQQIAVRRAAHHEDGADVTLGYPDAGHWVGSLTCDEFPTTVTSVHGFQGVVLELGGSILANAEACAAAREKVLAFLDRL